MTDQPEDAPLDGEITPPDKGKGKSATGKGNHKTRTSGQTPEQREEEETGAKVWFGIITSGGFDWRGRDWEPTKQQRDAVATLKFCGYNDEDIAYCVGMSPESLARYFAFELRTSRMLMVGDLAGRAFTRARQGDATLSMFLLKTRGGGNFSERAVQMQTLTDALDKTEPDEKRRVELVGKILDLLDSAKQKPKAEKSTTKKEAT